MQVQSCKAFFMGAYRALAERPLRDPGLSDVLAFERELATVREKLRGLEEDADPAREGAPWD